MLATRSKILLTLACLFVAVSCHDQFDAPEPSEVIPMSPNMKIADVKQLMEQGYIDYDLIIGGRITTSDSAQNFYKRCFIEDETGGIEVAINNYDIYSIYPLGDSVWVNLRGLSIGVRDGIKCIGYPVDSTYIEPISSIVMLRKIIYSTGERQHRPHRVMTFDDLVPSDIGRLVTVEAYFPEIFEQSEFPVYEGVRELKDRNGDIAKLRSTQYCKFASNEVPHVWVFISAIVIGRQESGIYDLMISDTDDVFIDYF